MLGVIIRLIPILISLLAAIWVIYDVLVHQKKMPFIEKLIWILAAILLGLIAALLYYFIAKSKRKYEDFRNRYV